jgi:hypothetical protein
MAGRSNTTLKKRQKEMARAEKQREKFAKRLERKKGEPGDQIDGASEEAEDSALADPLLTLPVNIELSVSGGIRILPPTT